MEQCQHLELADCTWSNGDILSQDESEAAREIIARFEDFSEILDEVDLVLERPALALPAFDRDNVRATTPPHADVLYVVARAFHLRARAQIRLSNGAAAMADIERSLAIGKLLRDQRTDHFLSWQTSTSVFTTIVPVIWEALGSRTWNRQELERLQHQIDNVDFAPGLLAFLRFSRSLDIEAATSSKARAIHTARVRTYGKGYRGYPITEKLRPQGWRYSTLSDRLRAWQDALFTKEDGSLNFDTVTLEMMTASAPLTIPQFRTPSAVQQALQSAANRIGIHYQPEIMRLARSLPELGASSSFMIESLLFRRYVLQRLCSTAIALERYQLEHGNYPEALSDLVPQYLADLPADPWTGKHQQLLGYSIRPGGRPALWSMGENRQDDKGFLGDNFGTGDDSIWHYEIAPDDPDHPDRIAEWKAREALNPNRKTRSKRRSANRR